jgi:hypothetical protein
MVSNGSLGEQLEIQVTEEVAGKPEAYTFAVEMEGIISSVFTPADNEKDVCANLYNFNFFLNHQNFKNL